ncbi:MAG: hypothetical protein P4L31_02260 [Candidatus Babeliales bacterium]|nr:hypothetical protein [Candidatus Babeliales bacterium]
MNNNEFSNDNNAQFILSYELLSLLRWLADHDAEKIKKIITKSLAAGLKDEVNRARKGKSEDQSIQEIQHGIIDFFGLLEVLLHESMSEAMVQTAVQNNLMPSIDQIDSAVCDDETVRSSLQRTTAKIENNPGQNPKELLFKELLKRWKPQNKNILN